MEERLGGEDDLGELGEGGDGAQGDGEEEVLVDARDV